MISAPEFGFFPADADGHGGQGLRAFYRRRLELGFQRDADPKTLKAYGETISHWERIMPNPPLATIGEADVNAFRDALQDSSRGAAEPRRRRRAGRQLPLFADLDAPDPGPAALAPATVNKHLRHLHALLVEAHYLETLPKVPRFRYCKVPRKRPRIVPAADLERIYAACDVATKPRIAGVLPRHWWQALLVVALVDGFRRQGLLGLKWDGVDLANRTIDLDADADKRDTDRRKPISSIVIEHLFRIRSAETLVFAWPMCEQSFYRQWWAIQHAAGLKRPYYRLHDLKRTCGTLYAEGGASPFAIREMLDHTSLDTSNLYVNPKQEVRAAVDKLRLPDAFYRDFEPPADQAQSG